MVRDQQTSNATRAQTSIPVAIFLYLFAPIYYKMQCYICVMYMMFLCGAHPPNLREAPSKPEQRSLFRDVIESLRIRSQLPEDYNQNADENNLAQNYERYSEEEDQPLQLPSDSAFIPRRNDRVEISALRHRSPKSLDNNFTVDIETTETPKGEIVVYIDTPKQKSTTAKPKKVQKKTVRPLNNKIKTKIENPEDVYEEETPDESSPYPPISNTMAGQSQIGDREQQVVVKPTVIVNFRGSIMHKDGEVKMGGGRKNEENQTIVNGSPQNIFNINQEIKLERPFTGFGDRSVPNIDMNNRGEVKLEHKVTTNVQHDMMICETTTPEKGTTSRQKRQIDNILQIVFSVS